MEHPLKLCSLFLLTLLNLPYLVFSNVDVQIYEFTRNETFSFPGKRLADHVYEEFSTKRQVIHCAYECLKSRRCMSFNYEHEAWICQLNDEEHQDIDDLTDDQNGTHFEYHQREAFTIDKEALGPCASDPCQNGARCLDTVNFRNERVFYCICEDDWMGDECDVQMNRIDWDEWQDWGPCSVSCETGWTTRRRHCIDTVTMETLSSAKCYGRDVEYKSCQLQPCPRWQPWADWGSCSTENTCGRGVKHRHRNCSNGGTSGVDRYCLGYTNQTAPCNGINCRGMLPIKNISMHGEGRFEIIDDIKGVDIAICADDNWSDVTADIVCKQIGFQGASEEAENHTFPTSLLPLTTDIQTITCSGTEKTIQECSRKPATECDAVAGLQCRVRGGWSLWSTWGDCSVTCENGTRVRTRECNHPPPNFGGTPCPGEDLQYKHCELLMCPKNGTWGGWESWSGCDVTCGEGERMRNRQCFGDTPCYTGKNVTYDICTEISCHVDGVWASWTPWSECDVTCANGTRFRTRECTGPFYDGAECPGPDDEVEGCFPRMCEVDGVWDEWGMWSKCSHTCGYGNRNRTRTCYGPLYGGLECPGSPGDIEPCNAFSCPVDGAWHQWTMWGECSVTCGGGLRNRTRDCNDPLHGGADCVGPSEDAEDCNEHPCPIDGVFAEWMEWSECSVTCANGTRWRDRICFGPYHGGANCTGMFDEEEVCVTAECPVDGVWKEWEAWQACNVTCGGGRKLRSRVCDGPFYGGNECEGPSDDTTDCNTHECPIDGDWSLWLDWHTCNVSCGGGQQNRTRVCQEPKHGGSNCAGDNEEWQPCNTSPCPVDGEWATWASWSDCNVTCGGGTKSRDRTCYKPEHGGDTCLGESVNIDTCNDQECPVDGVWETWSNWTDCSLTCGSGDQERVRTCQGPFYGGAECAGAANETQLCNEFICPIDGIFGEWTLWSDCSETCGGGTTYRNRTCFGPYFGGAPCDDIDFEDKECNPSSCPVNGIWNPWVEWTDCSTSCENGTRTRDRTCDGPYFGGDDCGGDWNQTEACFLKWCPVDGIWQAWSDWDECPVSCGGDIQNRTRTCTGPFHQGAECEGDWDQSRDCNTIPCPVDGEWSWWSKWSACNTTCGGGTSGRYRYCSESEHGGSNCTGDSEQFNDCNMHECPIDGVWKPWIIWSECSHSCGTGERVRHRTCDGPYYDGAECDGATNETEECNTHECPVDGVWQLWADWSSCNVTCGGGTRWRNRTCTGPFYGGAECPGLDFNTEVCNTHECPIDGVWENWALWEECSVTCGGGDQSRDRTCTGPFYGGDNCTGPYNETRDCNTFECPIDGVLTEWSEFYACNVTCGGGIQLRNRTCYGPYYGGLNCTEPLTDSRECNMHNCPINGMFTFWSSWEHCDVTCGGGIQWRNRTCNGPYYGGADCVGSVTDNRTCNVFNCPIDGVWEAWTDWDECPVTCGGAVHSRYRNCTGPFYNGSECDGPKDESRDCNIHNCPVDGVFTDWSAWEQCDVTCGGGIQSRNRSCVGPFYGGVECEGPYNNSQDCNTHECPIDGVWIEWGAWQECSTTCGGGTRIRERTCDGPFHGGADCDGSLTDDEICGTDPCPIPGLWFAWTPWSLCSATCGGGIRDRNRTCDWESFGELTTDCEGEPTEEADCHNFDCEPYAIHCADWASRGLNQSCIADIDPDGTSEQFGTVQVECDFDTEPGKAVTVIHHKHENKTNIKGYEGAGEYQVVLDYYVGWMEAITIIDSSNECAQFMRWDCMAAIIHNPFNPDMLTTFWMNRTEQMTNYFGGATPGSGNCACGETNSCFNNSLPCNCDENDAVWRFDEGFVTTKSELPIHSFYAGDTGGTDEDGYKTIGPVLCSGTA